MSANGDKADRQGTSSEGTTADASQIGFRKQLEKLFVETRCRREDLLFNLGCTSRSSLLVKFLVMNDIYGASRTSPAR